MAKRQIMNYLYVLARVTLPLKVNVKCAIWINVCCAASIFSATGVPSLLPHCLFPGHLQPIVAHQGVYKDWGAALPGLLAILLSACHLVYVFMGYFCQDLVSSSLCVVTRWSVLMMFCFFTVVCSMCSCSFPFVHLLIDFLPQSWVGEGCHFCCNIFLLFWK